MHWPKLTLLFLVLFVIAAAERALAGGGPENILLVVNGRDAGSKTIANYFIQSRRIPPNNVLYLDWKLGDTYINVSQFRDEIMAPIQRFLDKRKLTGQIDSIVYSSAFPWGIRFHSDVPEPLKKSPYFTYPTGSLSGLTYLYSAVLEKDATRYAAFGANRYMRLRESKDGGIFELPLEPSGQLRQKDGHQPIHDEYVDPTSVGSHGFRSWYGWGPKGELLEAGGAQYMLSTVLGVTYGRGNTVREIVDCLRNSPTADGTYPRGTIYLMRNADIRSITREPGFAMAVDQLKQLGVNAKIVSGDIPNGRPDVQGLLAGIADFDWPRSGSRILPGAICENLTSYSAIFDPKMVQTPCSVFIRYGAAGASGTVAEPYSIQNKFPHAMIQVHYARGCTMAEAFYQSVYMPYQLLVLGDPLCRPWANIPKIKVDGVGGDVPLKGAVTLQPSAELPREGECDRFELFIDGQRIAGCAAGGTLEFDSTKYSDGFHDLRVVGIERSPIETQGVAIILAQFDNNGSTMEFTAGPERVVAGRPVKVSAKCLGADGVAIYHNGQTVATIAGEQGAAEIDSLGLGDGPVTLTAIAWHDGAPYVTARPVKLFVQSGAGGR